MLVVKRRRREQLCIGDHICLTVAAIGSGHVQVAIEAPEGTKLCRREIIPLLRPISKSSAILVFKNKVVLALKRGPQEQLLIGDHICLMVMSVDRGEVGFAIEAPEGTKICRREGAPF